MDIVTDSLGAGIFSIAAIATNAVNADSLCSSSPVAYEKKLCPSDKGEYVAVPGSATLLTSDFCVAKYEMKNPGSLGVAKSEAAGNPWVSISQTTSKTTCTNLGAGYALINNAEWMTIARDLELVDENWSEVLSVRQAGVGELNRGWSASTTYGDAYTHSAVAPSTAAGCLFHSAANTCAASGNHRTKRTHTLSNNEEIWDIAGNVWEWVDWNVTAANKAYSSFTAPNIPVADYREWSLIDSKIGAGDEMKPETWESQFFPSLGGAEGLGRYYSGINSSGGAALRGGAWSGGQVAGAFALHLDNGAGYTHTAVGFRCVFRP